MAQLLLAAFMLSLTWFVLAPQPALAYLDPGAGSYIVQLIVGGILSMGIAGKQLFGRREKNLSPPTEGKHINRSS